MEAGTAQKLSGFSSAALAPETRRQGDKETRRQRSKGRGEIARAGSRVASLLAVDCPSIILSPCLLVSLSPCLLVCFSLGRQCEHEQRVAAACIAQPGSTVAGEAGCPSS